MKKLLVTLLAVLMCLSLAACGKKEETVKTDSEYVKANGKLVVGITDFAPMDYQDGNGEWIGFDADMGKAFAKELGVDVEFVEIDWDNKIMELNSKSIDCIWNGMTLTDEVKSSTATSNPYSNNSQVIVVKKENAEKFKDADGLAGYLVAVEAGSAGQEVFEETGVAAKEVIYKDTQANALLEVASGTVDACIIDYAMAAAMTGEGTSYADLVSTASLNSELYGVAFRTGSDLADKLNDFFKKTYADGTMMTIATTYGIENTIIAQ
ncbi:MAG: transporter substrate-binding domain-containing protein [Erysipelotrichaceae bacterium]|nr:transporter substrate-binding domain-containing protein [Erysipelotrichaceae bacterium]